jgi:hypothetical protein
VILLVSSLDFKDRVQGEHLLHKIGDLGMFKSRLDVALNTALIPTTFHRKPFEVASGASGFATLI